MKAVYKISVCLLSMLLLFSTSSFTVSLHYCGKDFAGFSFNDTEMVCGMENMHSSTDDSCDLHKENCCHTKTVVVDGQNERQTVKKSLVPHQQIFITAFIYTYINLFQEQTNQFVPFKHYNSPLLVSDTQLLYETFII